MSICELDSSELGILFFRSHFQTRFSTRSAMAISVFSQPFFHINHACRPTEDRRNNRAHIEKETGAGDPLVVQAIDLKDE
jgi:hypothetical protein